MHVLPTISYETINNLTGILTFDRVKLKVSDREMMQHVLQENWRKLEPTERKSAAQSHFSQFFKPFC